MEGSEQTGDQATATQGGGDPPPAVPEDARRDPDAPESVTESVARARERLAEGGSILDVEEADAAEDQLTDDLEAGREPEPVEAEAEGEEEAGEEIERPELAIDESDRLPDTALPDGWQYDDHNRLHRPDGGYASLAEHEELRKLHTETSEEIEDDLEGSDEIESDEGDLEEDEDFEELLVEIPGREEGETFELAAADKETAERLRQLSNGHMRRAEFNRQMEALEREKEQFQEVADDFLADPARFLVQEKIDPDIRKEVVLRLLAHEDVYDEVSSTLRQWEMNPDRKRADIAEIERDSYERRFEKTSEQKVTRTARAAARQAREHVETLLQEAGVTEGKAATSLLRKGMSEIGRAMMNSGRYDITVDDARHVLEQTGTLDLMGLPARGSGESSSSRNGTSEESRSPRRVRAVDPDSEEAEQARRTGEELKKKAESRRAAAATPQGAGASAATQVEPPEGQSVEERIKWARDKGLGAILSGR